MEPGSIGNTGKSTPNIGEIDKSKEVEPQKKGKVGGRGVKNHVAYFESISNQAKKNKQFSDGRTDKRKKPPVARKPDFLLASPNKGKKTEASAPKLAGESSIPPEVVKDPIYENTRVQGTQEPIYENTHADRIIDPIYENVSFRNVEQDNLYDVPRPQVDTGHYDVPRSQVDTGHYDVPRPQVDTGHYDVPRPQVDTGHYDVPRSQVDTGHYDVPRSQVDTGHYDVLRHHHHSKEPSNPLDAGYYEVGPSQRWGRHEGMSVKDKEAVYSEILKENFEEPIYATIDEVWDGGERTESVQYDRMDGLFHLDTIQDKWINEHFRVYAQSALVFEKHTAKALHAYYSHRQNHSLQDRKQYHALMKVMDGGAYKEWLSLMNKETVSAKEFQRMCDLNHKVRQSLAPFMKKYEHKHGKGLHILEKNPDENMDLRQFKDRVFRLREMYSSYQQMIIPENRKLKDKEYQVLKKMDDFLSSEGYKELCLYCQDERIYNRLSPKGIKKIKREIDHLNKVIKSANKIVFPETKAMRRFNCIGVPLAGR